jgi:Domain of unknown function (DUF4157)
VIAGQSREQESATKQEQQGDKPKLSEPVRAPGPEYARELLHLQATGGNAMVGRLLRGVATSGDPLAERDQAARDDIAARIHQRLGRGERLAPDVHERFAPALGASLAEVRIHTDPGAADLAREVNARAFTTGSDVFFGAGAYEPQTARGAHLLAHELTHTVQRPATPTGGGDLRVSDPGDRDEQAAEHAAGKLVAGDAVAAGGAVAAGDAVAAHPAASGVDVHRAVDTTLTSTDKSESSYDPASAAWSSSSRTSVVSGDESASVTRSGKRSVGLAGGDFSYGSTTSTQSEESGPGYSGSSSRTDTKKLGTGGYSSTTSTTERAGDVSATNTSGTSYSAAGGKFGRTTTTGQTSGTVDDKGELVRGTSTTRTAGGGVLAGPDGYGGYGTMSGDASQTLAKGVKVGVSGGLDGRFTVNVIEVPGSSPVAYQIVTTISLGAKLGVSGGADRGASGSVSGSASGAVTATYAHVLPEAEAQRYLTALNNIRSAPVSGLYRELDILGTAVRDGDETAVAMLRGLQAGVLGDPGAAAGLGDGDSVTLKTEGKIGANASVGAKGAGGGIGASGGVSAAASMTWTVARKGDKVLLTGAPARETGWSASGTGSVGIGSMGYGEEHKSSSSQAYTFILDPKNPDYDALYRLILGADGAAGLAAIAKAHPELVAGSALTTGTGETDTVTAGLGPVGLSITSGSARSTTTATGPTGQTVTDTGTGTGGAGLTLGGVNVANYNESGSVTTTTGPDRTAKGDVNTSTSESDWWKTIKGVAEHPWDSVTGLFTGSTKLAQDTDVAGMKLSDADYARISAAAASDAWRKVFTSVRHIADWNQCQARVLAAGGDRRQIGAALADFVAGGGSERAQMVQQIVRGRGSAVGGARYEWPGDLAAQKSVFESLVDGDPLAAITAAQEAGNYEQAGRLAADAVSKLDTLVAAMRAGEDKFADTASYGEMLRRIGERRAELVGRSHLVAAHVPAPTETTVPTPEQAAAKDEAGTAAAKARYDGLMTSLRGFLDMQTRIFGIIQAEQAKKDNWFDRPDVILMAKKLTELKDKVYPEWENAFQAAVSAAKEAGLPAPTEPVPAWNWWQRLHDMLVKDY